MMMSVGECFAADGAGAKPAAPKAKAKGKAEKK
jgi:hypothetical protein